MAKLLDALNWGRLPECDGCRNKSYFRRRNKCFSCKNLFCDVCIQKQPDKKMYCRNCQILTATPLDKNDLLNLRSRDLIKYLTSRKISTSGCLEKEDLVNVLMREVNNSNSSSSLSISNSSNNGYNNSPGRTSVSNGQPDSDRKHLQADSFNEDGIRIVGTDVTDNEGSCSSHSNNCEWEKLGESDQSVTNETDIDSTDRLSQFGDPNEGACGQSSTEPEVPTSAFAEHTHTDVSILRGNKLLKLSDISCLEDLDKLSVKELKTLLMTNRTDFKGCVERAELLEKAGRLWNDYTLSRKDLEKLNLEELCKICMDAPIECVLLECGHMATCMICGKQLCECPVCRQYVVRCVRTFKV